MSKILKVGLSSMVSLDYLYNPEFLKPYVDENYFNDKKLGFQVIEKGIVLPFKPHPNYSGTNALGGIIDSNGTFIKGSHIYDYKIGRGYTPPPPESIQHSSETAIYLGYFFYVWGHCITDNIRRIWFLKSEAFKREFKKCPLVYISYGNQSLEKYKSFSRLLEILEVDVNMLQEITQPTQFEKIIMPDSSFAQGFTSEYRETINCLRNFAMKNRTPTSNKKIYYFHGARQIGEERLAEYFKSKGYAIISPEKLTLDEQLNWLINCESFAAPLGSVAHNSVFLRDNTETIMIPRADVRHSYHYQVKLDQVNSINTTYIDSSLSLFSDGGNNLCYIIGEPLKKFFGDKWDGYDEEDFKIFLQYAKEKFSKNILVRLETKMYYKSILIDFMSQLQKREDLIASYNMPLGWEQFRPLLTYQTYVSMKGWGDGCWKSENQISNPLNEKLYIEAIKINFPGHKVYYSVYYNDTEGWSAEVSAPEMVGITGKAKSIYGIRIRLDEAGTKEFNILYRAHKFNGSWTPWAKNGEVLYSYGIRVNAIQIKLETFKPQSAEKTPKHPNDIQTSLTRNNEEVFLPVQRQDITQIKL